MFKIKPYDQFTNVHWLDIPKSTRYVVQYEQLPDITKGCFNRKFHESHFSDKKKALSLCSSLSEFLSDVYFTLDLLDLKLKQLEFSLNTEIFPYSTLSLVFETRIHLLKQSKKTLFCYQHIDNMSRYIYALKKHCFTVCECFKNSAEQIFQYLLKLEDYFINSYRSAQILHETKSLKFFLC